MVSGQPLFADPFWIDGVLSESECQSIVRELDFAFWRPSAVVLSDLQSPGATRIEISAQRTSESADERWFSSEIAEHLRGLGDRVEKLIPSFELRREKWQATRYEKGGKFDFHFDCGSWKDDEAGDRQYSVLLFLNTPSVGGGTYFLLPDIEIEPMAGRLAVWSNLFDDGTRNPSSLHTGLPVVEGRKIVLVTWVRQRELR